MTATLQTVHILKMLLSTAHFVRETPACVCIETDFCKMMGVGEGLRLRLMFLTHTHFGCILVSVPIAELVMINTDLCT